MNALKRLVLVYLAAFALVACGDKKDEAEIQPPDEAKVDLKAEPEKEVLPTTPVESQTQEDTREAKPGEGETEKPSQADPKPGTQTGETALAMATTAIPNTVTFGGCFLEKRGATGGSRSVSTTESPQGNVTVEKSEPTGGPQKDAVTIEKGEASITVHHALTHNCCYRATVKTGIDEHRIRVLEVLAGETCRCMCHSTITTKIDLPGPPFLKQYHVKVEVDNNGTLGPTHEEVVYF